MTDNDKKQNVAPPVKKVNDEDFYENMHEFAGAVTLPEGFKPREPEKKPTPTVLKGPTYM